MNRTKTQTLLLALCLAASEDAFPAGDSGRPNVLFIAADDLRMNLGCYGDRLAVTPNLDRLAARGLRFDRAYCQFASCNASRASVLTGCRPDTIAVHQLNTHFRDTAPDVVTLPQHFRLNGYHTEAVGKVLHNYSVRIRDNELSWSVPARLDKINHFNDYALEENIPSGDGKKTIAAECANVGDDAYVDGQIVADAVQTIKRLAAREQPFFLAVGFMKPHSPYNAPKKHWDLYDRAELKALCPETRPEGAPEINWWESSEIRDFQDVPAQGLIPDETQARMRHGYYAATSYLDANVGRLLDALDSAAACNTIVVFWSDHGYHLGENRHWAKATVRDLDAHVPLIVAVPGGVRGATVAIVEYTDLYPTLSDLCGLPEPANLDGRSFARVIENPQAEFRLAALTQVCRPWGGRKAVEIMGYSIRTARHRYTQWVDQTDQSVIAEELYDLDDDPFQRSNQCDDAAEALARHRRLLERETGK